MSARLDAIGNAVGPLRRRTAAAALPDARLASRHGARRRPYDGMLGVITAIECVAALNEKGRRLPFAIEVHRLRRRGRRALRHHACSAAAPSPARSIRRARRRRTRAAPASSDALREFGLDPARVREIAAQEGRRARLCRAAHRAGAGARSRRPAGRRGDRHQRLLAAQRRRCAASPATPAPCRWACGATRSPPRPSACSRSSASRARMPSSSAPSAASRRSPARST